MVLREATELAGEEGGGFQVAFNFPADCNELFLGGGI
jgi:hypothetical protein